jgi:hypothetical protein
MKVLFFKFYAADQNGLRWKAVGANAVFKSTIMNENLCLNHQ